jgi:uncharacterized protein YndB with AHSA1/START domain
MLSDMPFSTSVSLDIKAPLARVWAGLTNPEIVKQYFFGTTMDTDWKVGSPIYFRGEWQGKGYEDRGTILAFDPMNSFSYNYWSSFSGKPDQPEKRNVLRFTLEPAGELVRLTVHQSNVETQAAADHSAENWRMVLGALKQLLESPTAGA